MKVEGKFILDYETLFVSHDILEDMHDCLLIVPLSSLRLYNQLVKGTLESNEFTEDEKETFKEYYTPFSKLVFSNKAVLEEITIGGKEQSSAMCLNTETNLFMCFSNINNSKSKLVIPETEEPLDKYLLDIVHASKYFDAPIVSISKDLVDTIKKYDIRVQYALVEE